MEAPEKIYVHEASAPELTEKLPYHIEYTRTDAFIEKACEFWGKYQRGFVTHKDIVDFKKYLKDSL